MSKQNPTDMSGDVLSQLVGKVDSSSIEQTRLLRSINESLQDMIKNGGRMSQANAVNSYGKSSYAYRSSRYSSYGRGGTTGAEDVFDVDKITQGIASEIARSIINSRGIEGMVRSVISNITGPITQEFQRGAFDIIDGIEHAIKSSILQFDLAERIEQALKDGASHSNLSQKLQKYLGRLADDLGVDKSDIKKALGRELGKKLLKNKDVKAVTDFWHNYLNGSLEDAKKTYESIVNSGDNTTAVGNAQNKVDKAKRELEEAQKLVDIESKIEKAKKELEEAAKQYHASQDKGDADDSTKKNYESAQKRLDEAQRERQQILSGKKQDTSEKNESKETKSSESEASVKKQQTEKKSDETSEIIGKAKDLSLSSQVCNITTQHANIEVSGIDLEALMHSKDTKEEIIRQLKGAETASDFDSATATDTATDTDTDTAEQISEWISEWINSAEAITHHTAPKPDESKIEPDSVTATDTDTAEQISEWISGWASEWVSEWVNSAEAITYPTAPKPDESEIEPDSVESKNKTVSKFVPFSFHYEPWMREQRNLPNTASVGLDQRNYPDSNTRMEFIPTKLNGLHYTKSKDSEISEKQDESLSESAKNAMMFSEIVAKMISDIPKLEYSTDKINPDNSLAMQSSGYLVDLKGQRDALIEIYKPLAELSANGISIPFNSTEFEKQLLSSYEEFRKSEASQASESAKASNSNLEMNTLEDATGIDDLRTFNSQSITEAEAKSKRVSYPYAMNAIDNKGYSTPYTQDSEGNLIPNGATLTDMSDARDHLNQSTNLDIKQSKLDDAEQQLADAKASAAADGVIQVFKMFTSRAEAIVKSNKATGAIYDEATRVSQTSIAGIKKTASKAFDEGKQKYLSEISSGLDTEKMSGLNGMISTLTGGATDAGAAMSGFVNTISALGPEALLTVGAFKLVTGILKKGFAPVVEGFKKTIDAADTALNRYHITQKKNIENSQKRLLEDINTLVSTPFDILKKGAEEWYSAWDNNLRTITATQGYTKADLQDLMASFAERLRTEGLTSVVSATDITNNLTKVLQSGLSGDVAEEFAYIATKLNAAVPTQDFFSYADTYASIAANAIRTGMDQSEAIEYANQQLTAFANNILYASREVAGGFTTGLKNAESLFKQSVQIAQTGKTYNASEISGVLTAVSAITGAIAPDLATAMTDAIYKAAVGGNSSEVVALRSLAGVNASSTDFLKELTTNPKAVFSELFKELAERQNMSADAYMEVAEGLSSIFGLSAESFARVDFSYLSQAIDSMDTSSKALSENMLLLKSGETTTNAESMKMQQINKMILDEGLSYVLDNEAARSIQEHMWNEQLARELQETEYGVNLHGAALELLEAIRNAVDTITTLLNPIKLLGKITSLFTSSKEDNALQADVSKILEAGKVGQGNALSKYNLTTYRADLKVVDDLNTMFGTTSSFKSLNAVTNALDHSSSLYSGIRLEAGNEAYSGEIEHKESKEPTSKLRWGTIGKSQVYETLNSKETEYELLGIDGIKKASTEASEANLAVVSNSENLQKMLDSMENYVKSNESASYEDWIKTSRSFGIADYEQVVKDSGLTNEQISNQYSILQAQIGAQQQKDRDQTEETYWDDTKKSLSEVASNTNTSAEAIKLVKDTALQISESVSAIQATYIEVNTKVGNIDTKVLNIDTNVSNIYASVGNISDSINSVDTKMDNMISAIRELGTASPNGDILKEIVDGISSIENHANEIYNGMYREDNNRSNSEDNTNLNLSVAGWLQFIYYKLAEVLTPTVEQIEENTSNSGADVSYKNGVPENMDIIQRMDRIITIMSANGFSFDRPMVNTINGQFTQY